MIVAYAIHVFRGTETLFTQGMCIVPSLPAAESIARDTALRRYPCVPVDGACVALFERCRSAARSIACAQPSDVAP